MKYWISFVRQLMTIFKFFYIDHPIPVLWAIVFKTALSVWQANIDIQPVFIEHRAIVYMCAYLSKSEESCSYAMKRALKISIKMKRIVRSK